MSSAVAQSHRDSNAANSNASVADELEWIHCNACYCDLWTASANAATASSSDHHHEHHRLDAQSTATASTTTGLARFAVAQCTHILCASCLSQASNPAAPGLIQCPVCHQVVHFNPLSSPDGSSFNPDLAQYFAPLLPQWSQLLSAAEFRQRNIDSLIRFLKDKLHLQRQGIERAAKELKAMRHLQTQYQAVVGENQALRMQLEGYLQQHQRQHHPLTSARLPTAPQTPAPTIMHPPSASRQLSTASFQRSHTTTQPAFVARPPLTSATRTSTLHSHPVTSHSTVHSHARANPRPPSAHPPSHPTPDPSTRHASRPTGPSLSRAATSLAPSRARGTAPASPAATVVSYSSGARMGAGQGDRTAEYLKRSASTMTAAGTSTRGGRELRSQLRGR